MLFQNIEKEFAYIEDLFHGEEISVGRTKGACDRLMFLRKQCNIQLAANSKAFLLYCIDTMLELIRDQTATTKKIVDFSKISRQVAQVYQNKRYFHSLNREIKNFRFKWGKEYFKDYKQLYRKSVEKDPAFMTEEEKKQYAQKTRNLVPLGIIVILVPGLVALGISKILTEECYIISCFFGMMLLQFGVLNLFADKQVATSHKTAASMIAGGGLMFLLSVVLWIL